MAGRGPVSRGRLQVLPVSGPAKFKAGGNGWLDVPGSQGGRRRLAA